MNKPDKLYRGIVLDHDKFAAYSLASETLKVPYEPILNSEGKEIVLDGNEYGIYMSDNINMVLDVYSNPRGGKVADPALRQYMDYIICYPNVGIAYEIDTTDVDVREPVITSSLQGVYNNGFIGKEWIADSIPRDKIKIIRIKISSDFLHPEEVIEVTDNLDAVQLVVKEKLLQRKIRLDKLIGELKNLPIRDLKNIGLTARERYKIIYGEDGIADMEINDIDTSNSLGVMKYVFKCFYDKEAKNSIPLDYLIRLISKSNSAKEEDKMEMIISIILKDIEDAERRKDNAIKRAKENNEEPKTVGFDSKIQMLKEIVEQIKKAIEKNYAAELEEFNKNAGHI